MRMRWFVTLAILLVLIAVGCGDDKTTNPKGTIPDLSRPAYSEPVWSSDGLRVGFNYRPLDSIYVDASGHHHYVFVDSLNGFWMVDSSGENMHRVYTKNLVDPSWSPSGDWIAYYIHADIWKIHTTPAGLDTTTDQQLTFRQSFFSPVWNPTSTWLLFYQPDGAGAGLYRLGAGGGAPELLPGTYLWRSPDWSRDSTRLAFLLEDNTDGLLNVLTSEAGGGNPQVIRGDLWTPGYPKWSPDGTKITFVDRDAPNSQGYLWIMDADGSNLRKVTPNTVGSGYSWSPDGTQIAYVRFNYDDHSYQNGTIWLVTVATGVSRQLTFNTPPLSKQPASSR